MRNIQYILLALVAFSIYSCKEGVVEGGFLVEGVIKNDNSRLIYLDHITSGTTNRLDTATISSDGQFRFIGTVEEAGIYRITVDKQHSWLFVLDNKQLKAELDYVNVEQYSVTGDSRFGQLTNLMSLYRENYQKNAELKARMQSMGQPGQQAIIQYRMQAAQLQQALTQNLKAFADTANSVVGLFAMSSLNMEQELNYISEKLPALEQAFPGNSVVAQLKLDVEAYNRVQVGAEAMDLTFNDPEGNPISLSSFRGQVVLLDFWASWCQPCRMTNPQLVQIYNEYADKGFTVYSVSLDKSKDAWLHAIAQDKLTWKSHVSDLKGWQAEGAQQYKVRSIPSTFLLDKNGIIVARNLHGDQLRSKIEELL